MKRAFWAALAAFVIAPLAAIPQTVPLNICLVTGSTTVTCASRSGYYVEVDNNAQVAQTVTVTLRDNGVAIEEIGTLGIGQKSWEQPPGKIFSTNLVATVNSGSVLAPNTGDGIQILWRVR